MLFSLLFFFFKLISSECYTSNSSSELEYSGYDCYIFKESMTIEDTLFEFNLNKNDHYIEFEKDVTLTNVEIGSLATPLQSSLIRFRGTVTINGLKITQAPKDYYSSSISVLRFYTCPSVTISKLDIRDTMGPIIAGDVTGELTVKESTFEHINEKVENNDITMVAASQLNLL